MDIQLLTSAMSCLAFLIISSSRSRVESASASTSSASTSALRLAARVFFVGCFAFSALDRVLAILIDEAEYTL